MFSFHSFFFYIFFDELLSIYFQKVKLLRVSIIINNDLFERIYM